MIPSRLLPLTMLALALALTGCPEIGDDVRETNVPANGMPNGTPNNMMADADPMTTMDTGGIPAVDMAMQMTPDMGIPGEDAGEDMAPDLPVATTWGQVAVMLDMKCSGCHPARFGGTPDEIRAQVEGMNASNGVPLITANDLTQSEIYLRVSSDDGNYRMPRPLNSPMDQVLRAALESWITNGAIY